MCGQAKMAYNVYRKHPPLREMTTEQLIKLAKESQYGPRKLQINIILNERYSKVLKSFSKSLKTLENIL